MAEADQAGVPDAWPKHHGALGGALWSAVTTALLIAVPVAFAIGVRSAFLFVSAGPIIYEIIERPLAHASSPRSTIVGHGLALLIGYSALAVFGLLHEPSTLVGGVTLVRAAAVLCGVGLLGALLVLVRATHPPAASTLLLVTLGIIKRPLDLACVFAMIVLLVVTGWLINRLAGVPVPTWGAGHPGPYDD